MERRFRDECKPIFSKGLIESAIVIQTSQHAVVLGGIAFIERSAHGDLSVLHEDVVDGGISPVSMSNGDITGFVEAEVQRAVSVEPGDYADVGDQACHVNVFGKVDFSIGYRADP
ncbi:hypothetical protein D3C84_1024800 [compost metagenome]